jgi:tetratricopeptide (TPR) repeat protein
MLLFEGKKADAEEVLKQANRDLPHEPGGFLALSNFYYATGDLDKAVAEYDALYRERPKDLQIKKRYIELLILAKRIDEARKLDDEILKSDPNDENALVYRSQMQIGWGDEARATETLQTVVKNTPNNSQAHYALGVAYEKQGNLDRAESEWREALKISPNLVEAQRALAGAAMRLGDMTTLAEAATQVIRLQPGSPDGYALRAVANINRQHVADAESDMTERSTPRRRRLPSRPTTASITTCLAAPCRLQRKTLARSKQRLRNRLLSMTRITMPGSTWCRRMLSKETSTRRSAWASGR